MIGHDLAEDRPLDQRAGGDAQPRRPVRKEPPSRRAQRGHGAGDRGRGRGCDPEDRRVRLRIVVLAELPRTRETLLLRLLGAGRLFKEALTDLSALPADAWEESIAAPLVIHFRLTSQGKAGAKEDDVSVEIRAWFEDFQRKLRDEGRRKGRVEEAARILLTVLHGRGIAVPDAARERILAERRRARIERWIKKAVVATSLADVIDEPS
jgi:hypothetical protein